LNAHSPPGHQLKLDADKVHLVLDERRSARIPMRLDTLGRRIGSPVAVGDMAVAIGRRGSRRVTWREGTNGKLASRFASEVAAAPGLFTPREWAAR